MSVVWPRFRLTVFANPISIISIMKFKSLTSNIFGLLGAGVLMSAVVSCSGSDKSQALVSAAALADSIVSADGNANVEVSENGVGMDASFRISDPQIQVQAIGQELFDAYASQQLKLVSPDDINTISHALRGTKGDITVQLLSRDQKPQVFTLSPQRFVELQKARLSQLDPGKAKEQAVKVAEGMCPNPKAHEGAVRVDVALVKGFIEYNIVWPSQKDLSNKEQSMLTLLYFNDLKKSLKELGELEQPVIDLLTNLGIDGVRVQYSAEDGDKVIKQAFPWRELQKPIEEYKI